MAGQLGHAYQTFIDEDPAFQAALKQCEHLHPFRSATGRKPYYIPKTSAMAMTLETIGSACFKLAGDNEYVLEGELKDGLTGEYDRRGRPARARISITLLYDGIYKEELHTWNAWAHETGTTNYLARRMWGTSPRSAMRAFKPIEEFLWDYERTPMSCAFELNEDTVFAGHRLEGELSGFRDQKGRQPKDFNRVIVRAHQGRILGADAAGQNPHEQVFSLRHLDKRPYEFDYRAPEVCEGDVDTIEIWNSCEIRSYDSHPLNTTEAWEKIADTTVHLICPDMAVVTVLLKGTMRQGEVNYIMSASVKLKLEGMQGGPSGKVGPMGGGMAGGPPMSFVTVKEATITSFKASATKADGPDRKDWHGEKPRLEISPVGSNPIVIIRESGGDRAEYLVMPPVSVRFDWNEDDAPQDDLIAIGPVNPFDRGRRPNVMMVWAEDQRVTGGDRIRQMKGSGFKTEERSGDYSSYRWTWGVSLR